MAILLELIASFVGMKCANFAFLLMTTIIESKPQLFGNFTLKFVDTCSQCASAVRIGCNKSY